MKPLLALTFIVLAAALSGCCSCGAGHERTVFIDKKVRSNEKLAFIPHHGAGELDTALAMNIQYEPIRTLRTEVESRSEQALKNFTGWNRDGEAHVTVITPVEYWQILRGHLKADEIDRIALDNKIQSSDLDLVGIGKGSAEIDGKTEHTYFVILRSKNLLKIRREIQKAYIRAGGKDADWNPERFYPHITIGFTLRDLHEADGVIKDAEHSLDPRLKLESY